MSEASTPASSRASRAASVARPEVDPPIRRSPMPVRSRIHSSVVSIQAVRSSLVRTFSGSEAPIPVMVNAQGPTPVPPIEPAVLLLCCWLPDMVSIPCER